MTSLKISSRASAWMIVLGFTGVLSACASEETTYEFWDELPESVDNDQVPFSPTIPQATGGSGQVHLGSGTIKSYFDETESEPSFSTKSIFANGFTLDDGAGLGGAGATVEITDPIVQLGLGGGDLTVLLLFDRSISMSDLWQGEPKWQVASRAFMNGMLGSEHLVTIGTVFFPQAAECEVAPLSDPRQIQFQVGTSFRQQWEAFPQNRYPSGGTPLGPAFEEAVAVIDEAEHYGLLAPGRRFRVAVVTDGQPNCGTDPERVLFLASELASRGVETVVIGLPGSDDASAFLDQLALVGGTYLHRAPVDEDEAEEEFSVVLK